MWYLAWRVIIGLHDRIELILCYQYILSFVLMHTLPYSYLAWRVIIGLHDRIELILCYQYILSFVLMHTLPYSTKEML